MKNLAATGLLLLPVLSLGCGEDKSSASPAASSAAADTPSSSAPAATAAPPAGSGAASGDAAAGAPPASPGPSKVVFDECTFEFVSPGLPKHDPARNLGLEQWINLDTEVVLAMYRTTRDAKGEPRTLADIEKKHTRLWDAPIQKGAANGISWALFHTGAGSSDLDIHVVGATETSTDAVACTFEITGPTGQEAAIAALAKSMKITVSPK